MVEYYPPTHCMENYHNNLFLRKAVIFNIYYYPNNIYIFTLRLKKDMKEM